MFLSNHNFSQNITYLNEEGTHKHVEAKNGNAKAPESEMLNDDTG